MADRPISELTQATVINDADCFVLQQDYQAKKLEGSSLVQYINRNSAISSIVQGSTDTDGKTHFTATFGGGQTFNYTLPSGKDIYLNGNPVVSYAKASTLSSTPPTSGWQNTLSALGDIKGYYVWTRYYISYNTGQTEYHYDVAYQGKDGTGAVNSVNGKTGTITLYGSDIAMSSTDATKLNTAISNVSTAVAKCEVLVITDTISSLPKTITNSSIENDMVCVGSLLSNYDAQPSDWSIVTNNGSLTISGTVTESETTTITLYLMKSR